MELQMPFVTEAEAFLLDEGYELGTFYNSDPFTVVVGYSGTNARPFPIRERHYTMCIEMPGIGQVSFTCNQANDRPIVSSFGGDTAEAIKVASRLRDEFANAA